MFYTRISILIEMWLVVSGFCLLSLPFEEYCLNVYWQEMPFLFRRYISNAQKQLQKL